MTTMNRWSVITAAAAVIGGGVVVGADICPDAAMVASEVKVTEGVGGFVGDLDAGDGFGRQLADLGDVDGDGVPDMAAGAPLDADGGSDQGAVWVLFLNPDGTVRAEQKISELVGGFGGVLDPGDLFGVSVTGIGDLDGDGVPDLAAGAIGDDDGGNSRGAMWILFLNADGTVRAEQKVSSTAGGFGSGLSDDGSFAFDIADLGDLDGDGVQDLAVGNYFDDDGGIDAGAVWILFMHTDGTVRAKQKISATQGGFGGTIAAGDGFGAGLCRLGDLDGDGVTELAVGLPAADDCGPDRGALYILFLNSDGTVRTQQRISQIAGGFDGEVADNDLFAVSMTPVPDLNGDGRPELAVSAWLDDDGGPDRGAVWILFLEADGTVREERKISDTVGGFGGQLDDFDAFAINVTSLPDLDGDGLPTLGVGSSGDDDAGVDAGALWLLELEPCTPSLAITIQPANVVLPIGGGAAIFEVEATGDGSLSYQWMRDGMMLVDGPEISGATTDQLTIQADNDAIGLYTVLVSDSSDAVLSAGAALAIRQSCPGDTNADGVVDIDDLLTILAQFGPCP